LSAIFSDDETIMQKNIALSKNDVFEDLVYNRHNTQLQSLGNNEKAIIYMISRNF